MQLTTKQDYYQRNREHILAKARERQLSNITSKTFRALHNTRTAINWTKNSIAGHKRKIQRMQAKLVRLTKRKEELELQWGQERAARKRLERENRSRNGTEVARERCDLHLDQARQGDQVHLGEH